ncbi:MAG: helix-turn-helix transcriptional regulator [Prevotella sp.]|nr:helix-turn-helix transcriptional regulator [Prevotella sp.]
MNNIDDNITIDFGKHISALRKRKGMTQMELAYKCDIHRAYIGAIERGEKKVNICTIFKLAKGLGVEPYQLLQYASR